MIYSRYAHDRDDENIINSANDYSSTEKDFIIKPPTGEIWEVSRMIFALSDNGILDSGYWGGSNSALTNGVKLQIWDGGKENGILKIDLFDKMPLKSNGQWGAVCYDVEKVTFGQGDNWLHARYTLSKDTNGKSIVLDGSNNDEIVIPLNDNFSSLLTQTFRFGLRKK